MRQSILVDVDHTLSDAFWRNDMYADPLVERDVYFAAAKDDDSLCDIVRLMNTLSRDYNLIILTARPEKWRQLTMQWLLEHSVMAEEVLMRPDNCFDPSPKVKVDLAMKRFGGEEGMREHIALVLDDREDVVAAFSALGITSMQIFGRRAVITGGGPTI